MPAKQPRCALACAGCSRVLGPYCEPGSRVPPCARPGTRRPDSRARHAARVVLLGGSCRLPCRLQHRSGSTQDGLQAMTFATSGKDLLMPKQAVALTSKSLFTNPPSTSTSARDSLRSKRSLAEPSSACYCAVDNRVGTRRCTLIVERSISSPTFGAMTFFQCSLSYTALYSRSRSASLDR